MGSTATRSSRRSSTPEPEVVVHQMTGLDRRGRLPQLRRGVRAHQPAPHRGHRPPDRWAPAPAGARLVVAQSFGNWNYERTGAPVKTESDPLDPDPPATMRRTLEAIRHLEAAVTQTAGVDGVALRYGNLYGPGTSIAAGRGARRAGAQAAAAGGGRRRAACGRSCTSRTRRPPRSRRSSTAGPAIYNVVRRRARGRARVAAGARRGGAARSRRGTCRHGSAGMAAGEAAVSMFTEIRGASNAKARRELRWTPAYRSWREGFGSELRQALVAA